VLDAAKAESLLGGWKHAGHPKSYTDDGSRSAVVRTYRLAAAMRADAKTPPDTPRGLMWSEHAPTLRARGVREHGIEE
jgi:hypothetical protein